MKILCGGLPLTECPQTLEDALDMADGDRAFLKGEFPTLASYFEHDACIALVSIRLSTEVILEPSDLRVPSREPTQS
jgi:hypothetical protein